VLGAIFYLAARQRYYSHELAQDQQAEWQGGLAVVKQLLRGRAVPTAELLQEAALDVAPEGLEAALYLARAGAGPTTSALADLLENRLEHRAVGRSEATHAFGAARAACFPPCLVGHILRPYEFAAHAASELLGLTLGVDTWRLK
jgi:hypothetical protein